jgi:hypothetical protein
MKKRTAAELRAAKVVVDREEAIAEERERRASERERRAALQQELADVEIARERADKRRKTVSAAGEFATDAARGLVKEVLLPIFALGVITLVFGYVFVSLGGTDALVGVSGGIESIFRGIEFIFPGLAEEAICLNASRPGRPTSHCSPVSWSMVLLFVLFGLALWYGPSIVRSISARFRGIFNR